MIGSIIGGALKIGSAIYGGRQAAKAAREKEKNLQNQIQQNEDWYNRRYNEDATQRADAQRLITLTEEALKKRNKAAQGMAAVMGSSTEAVAAEKAASAQALADMTGQIVANNEARKDKRNKICRRAKRAEHYLADPEADYTKRMLTLAAALKKLVAGVFNSVCDKADQ